jgi:hypothetical protein
MALPKAQNPLDWLTQCWHIILGQRAVAEKDGWLIGPVGRPGEGANDFIERLAGEEHLTVHRNVPGSGLLTSFDEWGDNIDPKVVDFYRHTCDYTFDTTSQWHPRFGALAKIVSNLFSRRVQQFNVPHDAAAFQSEIIRLTDGERKIVRTLWLRSIRDTGEVVSFGIYSKCVLPNGTQGVSAVFPLPQGNVTVIFAVQVDSKGGLRLVSSGKEERDTGFYVFVEDCRGNLWNHYLPSVRQQIYVYNTGNSKLMAKHTLDYGNIRAYEMTYSIVKERCDAQR